MYLRDKYADCWKHPLGKITKSIPAISTAILVFAIVLGVVSVAADSTTPVNGINTSFNPITTTVSYNYDFLTGTLVPGTAKATALSAANIFLTVMTDPAPPDMRNGATFFGTARPVHFQADTVVFEQSVCAEGSPTCLLDGSLTFGGLAMRHVQGDTLDQLTELASQYYIQSPSCDGGGAPRFVIDMSNGKSINVYFGTYPSFTDCTPSNTWQPGCPTVQCGSTNNMASDSAGLRWDDSQLTCGTFYQLYSQAVTCANSLSLTISSVAIITDSGWFGTNAGPSGSGQTLYFSNIQVNSVTRFP